MKKKGKIAILLSGRGSNFEAIYHNSQKATANFEIVAVISNKKKARGLELAREFNIDAYFLSSKKFNHRDDYEKELLAILKSKKTDLVCLAGYMRLVGHVLLDGYKNRIMNIHPALLPSFPGLDAQQQALDHGVTISGCTVHFINDGVDTGPIILQKSVKIYHGDTKEILSERILKQEHELFSKAITLYFNNRLKLINNQVIIEK